MSNPLLKVKQQIEFHGVWHLLKIADEIKKEFKNVKRKNIAYLKKHNIPFKKLDLGVSINMRLLNKEQCAIVKDMNKRIGNVDLSKFKIKTIPTEKC